MENHPSSSLIKNSDKNLDKEADHDNLLVLSNKNEPTVNQVWGPFYVQYAPFRAKISPIHAAGTPLIIKGRVFALDTHRPLSFVSIDIWQVSSDGEYDYYEINPNIKYEYKEELNTHGRSFSFDYRARLITDEQGRYEFETIKPPPYFYKTTSEWRCPHIHYYVQYPNYKSVVTQLYFKGEDKNDTDRHICENNTIELREVEYKRKDSSSFKYFIGEFDIIMAPMTTETKQND